MSTDTDTDTLVVKENIEDDIFDYILKYMKQAQYYIKNDGKKKKIFVIKKIKELLGDSYERYEPMILVSIDFIKTLSKNKSILKALHKDYCLPFFKC